MEWSYSGSKSFYRCQRRWYFQEILANSHPKAKDALRRETYLLSQLQSIEAWRGSVVDWVIKNQIIRSLSRLGRFSERRVLEYAKEIFDQQLIFARNFRFREDGMTKTKGDDQYAALFNLEYGIEIRDSELEQAWNDIETALRNLMGNDEIITALREADQLVAQRTLYLHEDDFTVKAIPDVIAFYENEAPLIIDWKVHSAGRREYWLQLGCYALALTRSEPHSDFFCILPQQYGPNEVRLAEFQLLLPQVRWYSLTEEDVDAIEAYIFSSGTEMLLSLGEDGNDVKRPLEFSVTEYPEDCLSCPFQKLCGADTLWVK